MSRTITVKFGGTSLADASQIRKAVEIVKSNPERKYLVASAPGKRFSDDVKVTDLLYSCYSEFSKGNEYSDILAQIKNRYSSIVNELGIAFDIGAEIETIEYELRKYPPADYLASRGEYLNSKIIAKFLGWQFVDAAEVIFFSSEGIFEDDKTYHTLGEKLKSLPCAVIPGFYGSMPDGKIHTFSRGGSDITGSIVARSVNADVYENWTDVSGMLSADPRIVDNPKPISNITYTELRELSYMGASVVHEDAVFPVRKAGIPINIRNTNRPDDEGTLISTSIPEGVKPPTVTGIAGRKGFTSIRVERSQMNGQTGFGARLLYIFSRNGVPFEHCPTGIDTISVVVNSEMFENRRDTILREIKNELMPDFITIEKDLAVIAVVGLGMVKAKGTASKIFGSLADADVNVRMIDQGSDELNIIIGVDGTDYERAVKALYGALIEN